MKRLALAALAAACLIAPSTVAANSVRVPTDYYGVGYHRIAIDSASVRSAQLDAIAATHVGQVRIPVAWSMVEPNPPTDGQHVYRFLTLDPVIADLARHGLTAQPNLGTTPWWNESKQGNAAKLCGKARSRIPAQLPDYGLAAAALVKRYGSGGSFWAQNPSLPYRPVMTLEVWNEPNIVSQWCPGPQPARYAEMFVGAAQAVGAVDPGVKMLVGGMPLQTPSGQYVTPEVFMRDAIRARPELTTLADAIAVHIYPGPGKLEHQLAPVGVFRSQLHAAGVPDSTPMVVNELGWATSGSGSITEQTRAWWYLVVPPWMANTNCNVAGILPHAWTTNEANTSVRDDFYGITHPVSAEPYPSAVNYAYGVATMLGQNETEAPHDLRDLCPWMPAPDADGDGVPDHRDYYPLDPALSVGPDGWGG